MTDSDRKPLEALITEQFPRVQRQAFRGVNLAVSTRRMLFTLDRYWRAYEGGSPSGWDYLWWCAFERERAKVERLLGRAAQRVRRVTGSDSLFSAVPRRGS